MSSHVTTGDVNTSFIYKGFIICVTNCTYRADVIYPEHVSRHLSNFPSP